MQHQNHDRGGDTILVAGATCWRIESAQRAAVLIDGDAYFAAVRSTLLKARQSVFIVGWDIDSRTRLLPDDDERLSDGAPNRLGELLAYIAEQRPALKIHVLLWDYSVLYALDREPLPALNLGWKTPAAVRVCLDDVLPMGASHHQKLVVVDDAAAFCGGLDLTIRRWDTCAHRPDEPDRADPDGNPYDPFHDMQMVVDGDAAAALGELVRDRWADAACEDPADVDPTGDPWPDDVSPDIADLRVGIARTLPALHDRSEVREVEALYLRSIEAAERWIYVENQYLTTDRVAEALIERLGAKPDLEVLVIGPQQPDGWMEVRTMGVGRLRFARRLEEAGVGDRVRLVHPTVGDGAKPVMVHAKLTIVDNQFLRIGSSNLNNRSMGLDTECDLAIEARDDSQRKAIATLRSRLLAEHLGVGAEAVGSVLEESGSLFHVVDTLSGGGRALQPIEDDERYDDDLADAVTGVADAERPAEAERIVGDMFGGEPAKQSLGRIAKLLIAAAALIGLVLLWQVTPLARLTDPESLLPLIEEMRGSGWVYLAMPLVYIGAGLVVFPITVLIALTAIAFGPWIGFAMAGIGALLSAATTYQIGAIAGRKTLRGMMGMRLNRISRAIGEKGVLSIAALRMVPVAPFSLINLVAGASHIRFRDYLAGTVLGMAPGMAVMTALGDRLREVWRNPTSGQLVLLSVAVAAWLLVSIGLQALASRLRRRSDK
ncbi:MAG: phospholipase [Inquilinus sp.]|nr:phospholipase [Inquilinus sp.]